MEWSRLSTNLLTHDQKVAQLLVRKCNTFDKRDSLVTHMRDLYSLSLRILVVARSEEYSILFPNHLDKGSYRSVAEDGIYVCNHDFYETIELVWPDF